MRPGIIDARDRYQAADRRFRNTGLDVGGDKNAVRISTAVPRLKCKLNPRTSNEGP